jgi:hypothetical protein
VTGSITLGEGKEMAMPGDNTTVKVRDEGGWEGGREERRKHECRQETKGSQGPPLTYSHFVPPSLPPSLPPFSFQVSLIYPTVLSEGLRFAVREGGRTVAAGVVAKLTK